MTKTERAHLRLEQLKESLLRLFGFRLFWTIYDEVSADQGTQGKQAVFLLVRQLLLFQRAFGAHQQK